MYKNKKKFITVLLLLLLCGESGVLVKTLYPDLKATGSNPRGHEWLKETQAVFSRQRCSKDSLNLSSLRRIKSPNMDMVFMTPTPLGEVTLTHDRFAEHIAGRHIVTIENIRTTLFYPDPEKVYRSRNRWVFERGDVRVVVTQEGLVTTAYIMDGR